MDDIKFDVDELMVLIATKIAAKTREQFALSEDATKVTCEDVLLVLRWSLRAAETCGRLYNGDRAGAKRTYRIPHAINVIAHVTANNLESEYDLGSTAYFGIYEKVKADIGAYLDGLRSLISSIQPEEPCSQ